MNASLMAPAAKQVPQADNLPKRADKISYLTSGPKPLCLQGLKLIQSLSRKGESSEQAKRLV